MHVQQDPLPARVHSESMDASLISNHRIEDQTSNVPEIPTTRFRALQIIASTSTVQMHAQGQHCPLTRIIANTSRLRVSRATTVGATLVAIQNISRNVTIEASRRQSVRRHVVENIPSAIPPVIKCQKKYLNDGTKGLELARNELMLILTEATAGQAFEEARGMSDWNTWIEQQAVEAIYNPTMTYEAVHPGEGSSGGRKSELYIKLENWKRGVIAAKGTSARNLPVFIDRQMADNIATQGRQGVIWLPRNAEIKALDREIFQGTFGVVRRVQIHGASFIPSWIEWAGKTMKAKNSLENRKERSLEALACPVDHPGVIKLQYLNPRTKESYSMWWNGGSLKNMRIYDHQVPEDHERDILQMPGADFEARKRLVVYRKHRAYLAWALMCIVDVVHNQDVLHNDLNPNNVMLHFPEDRENTVFIGVCDWGMASWGDEDAPSNYGRDSVDDMKKHREKYNCAGPELFHVRGQRGTSTSPVRMARKHRHTYLSESFSVGVLAKKIYAKDAASPLFQLNSDPNGVMMRFELALEQLTRPNPAERSTITHIVNILKSPPYNIVTPTMCFRDTAK